MKYTIRELRARYRMSQTDLAELVGVSRVSICNIENGHHLPLVTIAIRIANELNTTVEQIKWESKKEEKGNE